MKTTPKIIFIIILLFINTTTHAKKKSYPFEIMIGMADKIVTGEIVKIIGDTCYVFKVDQSIKGDDKNEFIVKIFRNWACDSRWKKPEIGQKLFLLLMKNGETFKSIGGSDGEIFIVENKLRLNSIYNRYASQNFNENNLPNLIDVISAVKNFMKSFEYISTKDYHNWFKPLLGIEEIQKFAELNTFSKWLFDRPKSYSH